jgi:NAD+ diphosphatase
LFRHCPACGASLLPPDLATVLECKSCGFLYHFNPTVAAGVFLVQPQGQVLFIRRAKDPARGKLALPGGFIEIGETAEESLRREILEEVGLKINSLNYLCSQRNSYDFRGITYPVLDLFFFSHVSLETNPLALEDVQSLHWLAPGSVNPDEVAFPSIREALQVFCASGSPARPA